MTLVLRTEKADHACMVRPASFEIPVDDPGTARLAAAHADRIEVCRDLEAEGLTPTPALLAEIVEASQAGGHRPEIAVLYQERPPPRDRTAVTPADFAARPEDLVRLDSLAARFADAGAGSIVLGFLDPSGYPDARAVSEAVAIAGRHGMRIAFHRAFDLAEDPVRAVELLHGLGVDRTLAAGSPGYDASQVSIEDRVARLATAAEASRDRDFSIVPCGGVRSANAAHFATVTPHAHASCRRRPSPFQLGGFDGKEAAALRRMVHGI